MTERTIEEVRLQYKEVLGKDPRNAIKNSIEKMEAEIKKAQVVPATDTAEAPTDEEKATDTAEAPTDEEKEDDEEESDDELATDDEEIEKTIRDVQQFYGITTEDLYRDEVLKKLKVSKEDMKIIEEWREEIVDTRKVNFDIHQAPDYVQKIIRKYGIVVDDMVDQKLLKEKVYSEDKDEKWVYKETEEKEKEIHQVYAYYQDLLKKNLEKMDHVRATFL